MPHTEAQHIHAAKNITFFDNGFRLGRALIFSRLIYLNLVFQRVSCRIR